ncbi:hypothetical protein QJQ58_01490 [Paenibacillus dendritiformis]|uniref:hypothetical protein n=1 Tax=Paenibacillus dendritiformis TaxID=130049 RepID=UPI00248D04E7|nr:hypothetical protein [Paenibacillus dendritiformis]WGU94983.1 hypothetical protein QJQ58_01490 [Paenibacillus dendritiformis]
MNTGSPFFCPVVNEFKNIHSSPAISCFKLLRYQKNSPDIRLLENPVFCEGVEMVHFPHQNFGSQSVLSRFFLPGDEIHPGEKSHRLLNGLILRDPSDRVGSWGHHRLQEALSACWKHRCLLGLGRAEEISAILQEFRLNESTSQGIAANLHHFRPFCFKPTRNGGNSCNFAGFPFWKSRPYRIAVFMQDFAYRIGVSGEIVEFCGFRLSDGRV